MFLFSFVKCFITSFVPSYHLCNLLLQEISVMIKDSRRKEKMYYHLQYGLFDTTDDHIPKDSIGAFLADLNAGKH
jgi:hypothetical protein